MLQQVAQLCVAAACSHAEFTLCCVLCAIQYAWPTTVLSDLPVLLVLLIWSMHASLQLGQFEHRCPTDLIAMPVPSHVYSTQ